MRSLLRTLFEKEYLGRDDQPFPPTWADLLHLTLPRTLEQFRRVSSLWELIENEGLLTLSSLSARKAEILEDIEIYQMRTRRFFVRLLEDIKNYDPNTDEELVDNILNARTGSLPTLMSAWDGNVDIETLRKDDPAQINLLNSPTAIFQTSHSVESSRAGAYPTILEDGCSLREAINHSFFFRKMAIQLLKEPGVKIGLNKPTLEDLRALGKVFRCERCPPGIGGPYSWETLVCHTVYNHRQFVLSVLLTCKGCTLR